MHHNIPHRFDTGLMTRAAKCAACLGPVRFGRTAARCAECHITAHPKQSDASPAVRRVAGPPKPPRQPSEDTPTAGPAGSGPGKAGWERRFLRVEEGQLTLYAEEPSPGGLAPAPLQTIDLRSATCTWTPTWASCRRRPAGRPSRTSFLCSSLPEKQQWVGLLESLLMLLGTEDGLYSLSLTDGRTERRIKVDGFPPVLMMRAVPEVDQLVFIAAASVSAARLDAWRLEGLQSCHLLAAGATGDKQAFVCAASSNRVCLFRWSYDLTTYQLVKQFSTQEPATCLHFTSSSIIIGTDRFFEVDLCNFAIEEFLDSSDASLAYIVYGTSQMRSFPVAILAVSEKEYLLCYHELGVFVDQFGSRSRKQDIKWTRLPLAFGELTGGGSAGADS
ncbi:citron rho-interacting kinase-like [Pollicipes pollicipes]|uniref:citron rho-interacting kinase-like n=1 Tax=Pollicipes pollicipes TaxID=41117 RepID=UPI0018859FF1|nr:citron rho-interacting kinase-like [Pollicipes pollicipes]